MFTETVSKSGQVSQLAENAGNSQLVTKLAARPPRPAHAASRSRAPLARTRRG